MPRSENPTGDLERLEALRAQLHAVAGRPLEFPEAGFRLDLESRAGDETRQFKHLHQMCLMHSVAFRRANEIKLLYLVDAFRSLAGSQNPLGMYAVARSVLELRATLVDIGQRLIAKRAGTSADWRNRGQGYFGIILRARYASSDPKKAEVLRNSGVSKDNTQPFNVMRCLEALAEHVPDARSRYDMLCDFVHHNLSSQTVGQSNLRVGGIARSAAGGEIHVGGGDTPIIRYEYPSEPAGRYALEELAADVVVDVQACMEALMSLPESPFSDEELIQRTGHRMGVTPLSRETSNPSDRVGRNDLCPCGSGKKFKNCCLTYK